MKKYEDNTGLFLADQEPVITSVEPREGKEGTIVKIKGSGFSKHIRNNCIVVGGMGACARTQEGTSDTELIVKIDPVANQSSGDVLVWVGAGSNFYNDRIAHGSTSMEFSETALFRNGTPVAQAGIKFKLTEASANTFGGRVVKGSPANSNLAGREKEYAMMVRVPKDFNVSRFKSIDICLVLKEHPTIAIDFTGRIRSNESTLDFLKALCKTIVINASHIGERVFSDVIINQVGDYEVYVTKPYMDKGLFTVHFS